MLHAAVTKRKGLSIKSRMLVLTNKVRLLYFDMQGGYKGAVPWTVTKPVTAHLVSLSCLPATHRPCGAVGGLSHTLSCLGLRQVNSKKFQVVVHDRSRTYHFTGTALPCPCP